MAAFAVLLLLTQKFKLSSGIAILVTGILINVFTLIKPETVLNSALAVFTSYDSIHTLACVLFLGILGNMLVQYGFLKQIVIYLKRLVHNKKLLIGSIPFVLGILAVPGGAYLSAPFVDELGNDLEIDKPRRAAINLSFRHATVSIYPFGANLLLLSALVVNYFSIYSVILLNLAFSVILLLASCVLYFPRGKQAFSETDKNEGTLLKDLKMLAFYTMPIYFVLLVNFLPFVTPAIALAMSIILTCFLCDRKNLRHILLKGINFNLIITLAGVFFIQNTIRNLDQFADLFLIILNSQSYLLILLGIAAGCSFIGLVSGLALVPLSIFVPIIFSLPISNTEMLIIVFFAWSWSFIGYYFSPVHLCQILTIESLSVKISSVYRENLKLFPILAASSFVLVFVYRFLLL